jgi:uncharacterized protein YndB with AHSA1/START domain
MIKREAVFTQDGKKKMTVVKSFDAPLDQVWKAWSDSTILDKWWAPKPYRAVTKSMDFRPGGFWMYAMTSPQDEITWCKENYKAIEPKKSITNSTHFCDIEGNENQEFPVMHMNKQFSGNGNDTTVTVDIDFDREEDLKTIVQMGFKEGFTMGLNNLEEYLSENKD